MVGHKGWCWSVTLQIGASPYLCLQGSGISHCVFLTMSHRQEVKATNLM